MHRRDKSLPCSIAREGNLIYRLQRASSITGTGTNLATNTAPASGFIEYHEVSAPPGQAFYHTFKQ